MRYQFLRTVTVTFAAVIVFGITSSAQTRVGTVQGTVNDPSGSVVSGAAIELGQPITGYRQTATTNENGSFRFFNVPFNTYALRVEAGGFAAQEQNIDVESTVPVVVDFALTLGGVDEEVTVTGAIKSDGDSSSLLLPVLPVTLPLPVGPSHAQRQHLCRLINCPPRS